METFIKKTTAVRLIAKATIASIALLPLFLLTNCATSNHSAEVVFQQDVYVWAGSAAQPVVKKKGETMELGENSALVEAPGYVGILLLPPVDKAGKINVALRPVEEWGGEQWAKKQATMLNDLVASMNEVQILLVSNHAREALQKLNDLMTRHPKVTYLNFLKASCLIVLGDQAQAKTVLETALIEFPDNQTGQILYRQIVERENQYGRVPAAAPGSPQPTSPANFSGGRQ